MTRNINEKYLLEFISNQNNDNELIDLICNFGIKLPICEYNSVYQIIENFSNERMRVLK